MQPLLPSQPSIQRPPSQLPNAPYGNLFVAATITAGAFVLLHSAVTLYLTPPPQIWLALVVLTVISSFATITLPLVPATLSVAEPFVYTSTILLGPSAGTITVALESLVMSYRLARKTPHFTRVAFNVASTSLSIAVSSRLFFAHAPAQALFGHSALIRDLLFPLLLFAACHFLINSSFIALAISLDTHSSPIRIWRRNLLFLSLNPLCAAPLAALLIAYISDYPLAYLGFVAPLVIVMYMTFKSVLARAEDTHRHLRELNALYISTIETLAMAIDAKDQVTHGHIRRVQQYAVSLASALGIRDSRQLQAIEAAALLHDMGKLAVPEHILNKPGKLTAEEFEAMKAHAAVGAEILSAIEFPYPVVPMVRHHHEHWSGGGYPDNICGTDIPIGARILAVVDCFDALTSDRPYRPRLSDGEAMRILMERRGTMYDPLVVDTFTRIYRDVVTDERQGMTKPGVQLTAAIERIATGVEVGRVVAGTVAADPQVAYEIVAAMQGSLSATSLVDILLARVLDLTSGAAAVVFVPDQSGRRLMALKALGVGASVLQAVRPALSTQLSGWVAANRRAVRNADAALELGKPHGEAAALRTALSVPLADQVGIVGVLTVYGLGGTLFGEDHERLLSLVGPVVAARLRGAWRLGQRGDASSPERPDPSVFVAKLPRSWAADPSPLGLAHPYGLIVLTFRGGELANGGGEDLAYLAARVRLLLREGDLMISDQAGSLVVLLPHVTADVLDRVAERIRGFLAARRSRLSEWAVSTSVVESPDVTLTAVLEQAGPPASQTAG